MRRDEEEADTEKSKKAQGKKRGEGAGLRIYNFWHPTSPGQFGLG